MLRDAQEMAKQYPDTFEAPSQGALENLELGFLVKVCDSDIAHRFWVELVKVDGEKLVGKVVSNQVPDYPKGSEILIEKRHVYLMSGHIW
jgi:hypothetical protein